MGDPERFQQKLLGVDNVKHFGNREIQCIRFSCGRIEGHGAGGDNGGILGPAVAQVIRTDDEIFICINGFARADEAVPEAAYSVVLRIFSGTMAGSGKVVSNKNGIALVCIQRAVCLIAHLDRECTAVLKGKGINMKYFFFCDQTHRTVFLFS